ncbi:MAG: mandelate racemase [Rhodobacteraceae bacterium]|nr:mandelate racemase [Paracoccaceae bacterium]
MTTPVTAAGKIVAVRAHALNVPNRIEAAGKVRETDLSVVVCEIETEGGLIGHGFTAITEERTVAMAITEVAAPALIGADPLAREALWDKLYWLMSPRGQTGYAMHAIAAIDIALWDLAGKILKQPVWKLLGGARDTVQLYVTCGFGFLDRADLASTARDWVDKGFTRLKMTVSGEALRRRDASPLEEVIAEDVRRVAAVREAVGPGPRIYVDANCNLDPVHALRLAQRLVPLDVDFFEEPIQRNDIAAMADLRARCPLPLAAGQNEGLSFRFRDLLAGKSVDVLQPNVTIGGGFTQAAKVAGMADAFATPIANGGGWPFHNAHLHAGLANGGLVEWHVPAVQVCRMIYKGLPEPDAGTMTLPDVPGLGFEPDHDAIHELAKRPSAAGHGKG